MKWTDPLAWMERQTPKTKQVIQAENALFKETVAESGTRAALREKQGEFQKTLSKYRNMEMLRIPSVGVAQILVEIDSAQETSFRWKRAKNGTWLSAAELDYWGSTVAYTVDTTEPYDYKLHVKTVTGQWTHPHGGGPQVAIKGDRVYYLEGDRHLRWTRLVSLALSDGKGRRILYEETDPSVELTLVRGENRALFLIGENAGQQALALIGAEDSSSSSSSGISPPLSERAVCFHPVGYSSPTSTEPIYFGRVGSFAAPWTLFGADWILNAEIGEAGIEFCSAILQILITKTFGVRTIWRLSGTMPPRQLYKGVFEVLSYSLWPLWRGEHDGSDIRATTLWVQDPSAGIYPIICDSVIVDVQRPRSTYGHTRIGESRSADGVPVRWALLTETSRRADTTGLMLVAYGAYGIATTLNTIRWIPWIQAGWAIALLFVRGGGDGNEMWAELGRLGGKAAAVLDVEACCRHLRDITGCNATNTCLFGRSAGGLLVGNMVSRNPSGQLFGAVYAEAPYVDLLKTASNPILPLTPYEYDEFGNPAKGPAEFEQTLRLSPIHTLDCQGAPGVKVLCRSGLNDIQVMYYESLKWIYMLRGSNAKDHSKIVYINRQSHHTYGRELCLDLAEDFLIINHWLNKEPTK